MKASDPQESADRIYAVGDVHGHLDLLHDIHRRIEDDRAARPVDEAVGAARVVHIGDYVDRGPDSCGVIDHLIARAAAGAGDVNLLGNHDRMFLRYMETKGGRDERLKMELWWLHERLGGTDTLRSYGLTLPDGATEARSARLREAAAAAVPAAHLEFLRELRPSWRTGRWFFAHAGVKPGVPLENQVEDDLTWIRDPFLESRDDHGATVIHGHTPVERVEDHGVRIAIDTGAAYGGPLSCVVLEGARAHVLGGGRLR